jgi:hypothetical protein
MSTARVKWQIVIVLGLAAGPCRPTLAQISMQRPGITGIPQARKQAPPSQAAQAPVTLTAEEQKRLDAVIKHMKRKDRKKFAAALQKMTPQQRQQLLANVKKQLAKDAAAPQSARRGW